jgi:DNA-binding response OmpR family regulator
MRALLGLSDQPRRDLIASALGSAGFDVSIATNGIELLQHWADRGGDLILLQVDLPELDGHAVCHRIRQEAPTPMVMLADSAASEDEVVRATVERSDDFVAEPFSIGELPARVRSVLRRSRLGGEPECNGQVLLTLAFVIVNVGSRAVLKHALDGPTSAGVSVLLVASGLLLGHSLGLVRQIRGVLRR